MVALTTEICFLSSGAQKSRTKVWAGWVSPEASALACDDLLPLCPHVALPLRFLQCVQISSLIKKPIKLGQGLPSF